MIQAPQKTKGKNKWLTIGITALIVAAVVLLVLYIAKITALNRAMAELDIENPETVIKVMKFGGKNPGIVLDIASQYLAADMPTDCARLCIYAMQYLDADCSRLLQSALRLSGADDRYISQFENADFSLQDFETVTEYGSDSYGVSDGVYSEFLGGYAKAKISAIVPIELYAYADGVFVLDSTDRLIKSISRDGGRVKVEINERAEEFLYFESQLYYIDENGIPHSNGEITLSEGEHAQNLCIEGEKVVCTVFDKDYEALRKITL